MSIRPLIISTPNPYGTGGQVRSYHVLKEIRSYLDDPGLILIGSPKEVVEEFVHEKYQVLSFSEQYLNPNLAVFIRYFADILNWLRNNKKSSYSIIVSQAENPQHVLTAYLIASHLKVPWTTILASYTCLDPAYSIKTKISLAYPSFLSKYCRLLLTHRLLNRTLVHPVSQAIPIHLESRGFSLKHYHLLEVPIGVDHNFIDGILQGKTVDKKYDLAYMARLVPEKGIFDLIRIIYLLKNRGVDANIIVIGDFENEKMKRKYFDAIRSLNLSKNFVFAGYLSGKAKYLRLAESKVFVYPSRADANPIVLLEALSVGLPAVTYSMPYTLDYNTDSVIKANNVETIVQEIVNLLKDPSLREKLGVEARLFSKKFTWKRVALSELNAYYRTIEWYRNRIK